MTKNHTGRRLALGALIAGAAGYVTGILTAPKSGKQTRQDVIDKAGEIKSEAEDQLQKAHDELNSALKNAKTKTVALGTQAKAEFNETVIRAKDARNKTAELLKAARAGEADDPELNKAIKQAKQARKNLANYFKS
ncbi:MAG: YtxH domain-containing protein [Candidatus Saccharimonadales bacterium]